MPSSVLGSEKWWLAGRESTSRRWEDTSMPTKGWGVSMFLELPSLQMRARGPGDCSGLLQGDVAARLRNGLRGPRVRRPTTSETTTTPGAGPGAVSYTHLRAHETKANLVCRLLL